MALPIFTKLLLPILQLSQAIALSWNARLSLTAIREPSQIIRRHFAECVFAAQHLPGDIERLLDYGSGAGLPGIPFAICRPEIRVTLAEAHGKKASFLREVVRSGCTSRGLRRARRDHDARASFHAVSMRAVEKMEFAIPVALQLAERYLVLLTTDDPRPRYDASSGATMDGSSSFAQLRSNGPGCGKRC